MSELNEFKIQQIVDNGRVVQMALVENVHTEPISQRQVVLEKVAKRLNGEARSQIMPLLDAILQAQPQLKLRTYQQTTITVSMPRNRYDRMGRPQVGHIIEIDMAVKQGGGEGGGEGGRSEGARGGMGPPGGDRAYGRPDGRGGMGPPGGDRAYGRPDGGQEERGEGGAAPPGDGRAYGRPDGGQEKEEERGEGGAAPPGDGRAYGRPDGGGNAESC